MSRKVIYRECRCGSRYKLSNRNYLCPACQAKKSKSQPTEVKMLAQAKHRAKRSGVPFSITRHDIVIPRKCPILGIPLEPSDGRAGPGSPSLDRIVPARGYVPGNVWVISMRANLMKNDASKEELRRFGVWALSQ